MNTLLSTMSTLGNASRDYVVSAPGRLGLGHPVVQNYYGSDTMWFLIEPLPPALFHQYLMDVVSPVNGARINVERAVTVFSDAPFRVYLRVYSLPHFVNWLSALSGLRVGYHPSGVFTYAQEGTPYVGSYIHHLEADGLGAEVRITACPEPEWHVRDPDCPPRPSVFPGSNHAYVTPTYPTRFRYAHEPCTILPRAEVALLWTGVFERIRDHPFCRADGREQGEAWWRYRFQHGNPGRHLHLFPGDQETVAHAIEKPWKCTLSTRRGRLTELPADQSRLPAAPRAYVAIAFDGEYWDLVGTAMESTIRDVVDFAAQVAGPRSQIAYWVRSLNLLFVDRESMGAFQVALGAYHLKADGRAEFAATPLLPGEVQPLWEIVGRMDDDGNIHRLSEPDGDYNPGSWTTALYSMWKAGYTWQAQMIVRRFLQRHRVEATVKAPSPDGQSGSTPATPEVTPLGA